MAAEKKPASPGGLLGIECGGTRTVALYINGEVTQRHEMGGANFRLCNERQLLDLFRQLSRLFPGPQAVVVGMAGVRAPADRERLKKVLARVWPEAGVRATNDLETALAAAQADPKRTRSRAAEAARVLVLSGTGSCCYGETPEGKSSKVGGWGHLIGDKGSGYEIGLRALKAVVFYYDRDQRWPALGARVLRSLQLNAPEELIGWGLSASKSDIAALAREVFDAWHERDPIARDILEGAAESLAKDAVACARHLVKGEDAVRFVLSGSVLLKQPRFSAWVARAIKRSWKAAVVQTLKRESVWGAVVLASALIDRDEAPSGAGLARTVPVGVSEWFIPASSKLSPTEERNPRSMDFHKLRAREAVALMLSEEARVPGIVAKQADRIARAADWIVKAWSQGGRLFYAGAGTSGRLGVLDASECPPTFRANPEQVQGIIAGGQHALWKAVEGAEDDPSAGAQAVRNRGVTNKDVFIGIAASGRTPFVWGALAEAKHAGARTVLVCFNPHLVIPRKHRPDIVIDPDLGPEVLTGSTRLKAGTATKLILNALTTVGMVRSGKAISNLMVDLNPSNAKLRDRAVRILCELTRCPRDEAQRALERSGWVVKDAWKRLTRGQRGGSAVGSSDQS